MANQNHGRGMSTTASNGRDVEAITATQADDYQSLEFSGDLYTAGRQDDGLNVSKRLAQAYARLGQISQAILEYEGSSPGMPDDRVRPCRSRSTRTAKPPKPVPRMVPGAQQRVMTPSSYHRSPLAVGMGAPRPFFCTLHRETVTGTALGRGVDYRKLVYRQAGATAVQRLKAERWPPRAKDKPDSLQLLADEQIAKLEDALLVLVNKPGCLTCRCPPTTTIATLCTCCPRRVLPVLRDAVRPDQPIGPGGHRQSV